MPKRRDEEIIHDYQSSVGKPPETRFPDDPDWNYKGTKAEREELLGRLGLVDDDEGPPLIKGQEELW